MSIQYPARCLPKCGPWAQLIWRDGQVAVVYTPELRERMRQFLAQFPEPHRLAYKLYRRLTEVVKKRHGEGEIISLSYLAVHDAARLYDPYRCGSGFSTSVVWAIYGRLTRVLGTEPQERLCPTEVLVHHPAREERDPEQALDDTARVEQLLATLPDQDRQDVIEYFGLRGERARTAREVGQGRGVTPQAIQARLKRAVRKMKQSAGVGERG